MSSPSTPEKQKNLSFITNEINGDKKLGEGDVASIPIDTLREDSGPCQVYAYRWVVLALFVVYSMSNAFQWIQFSIITGIIVQFYGVTEEMVDMTSMIYMITYIPLIFPATFFLEKKGLRLAVIIGSLGTALGSWIKVFACKPDLFYVAFIGHTVVAISQTFILGIPPLLAALWFGPDQVSTATSIGVFGNQLGVAAGFLLPTLLVKNGTQESIGNDLSVMFYGTGAITGLLFFLVLILFRDKPPTPPSLAQLALLSNDREPYLNSIKKLMTNKGYLLLLLSYGMNVGVFYAISTLLSSFIEKYFPDNEEDTGRIGLMIVVSGMVGSVISGFILDKTKKYKETTLTIYFLSFVGMIAYTFTLPYGGHIAYMYVVFSALGCAECMKQFGWRISQCPNSVFTCFLFFHPNRFFMTGYLPVGFEFAAEITYPESEGTSSGLLNAAAQVFGIIMTPITRYLFKSPLGDMGANLALAAILFIGFIMTALIKADLRRTAAQNAGTPYSTNPGSVGDGIAIASVTQQA
ncbi:putative MFS-type transporter C09D4.1 [Orchesella cincta]|uniref:Putative MFS-type transporter C09D4.1 n=1 Tax=Orchesella cincta TaxID=48709 RepID=A0A1D2NJV0_ORCCI|nr:putative MFS-type transporter C09D4.1 [Orchesella cincta]